MSQFMRCLNWYHITSPWNPDPTRCNPRLLIGCYLRDAPRPCTDTSIRRTPVPQHGTYPYPVYMPELGAQIKGAKSTGQSYATFKVAREAIHHTLCTAGSEDLYFQYHSKKWSNSGTGT